MTLHRCSCEGQHKRSIAYKCTRLLPVPLACAAVLASLGFTVPCVPQLSQVRQAAASLERVAGAMARQAATEHHGRDSRAAFTVGPVENRDQHREQRRSSASISF